MTQEQGHRDPPGIVDALSPMLRTISTLPTAPGFVEGLDDEIRLIRDNAQKHLTSTKDRILPERFTAEIAEIAEKKRGEKRSSGEARGPPSRTRLNADPCYLRNREKIN
jgi:hypothetical protein